MDNWQEQSTTNKLSRVACSRSPTCIHEIADFSGIEKTSSNEMMVGRERRWRGLEGMRETSHAKVSTKAGSIYGEMRRKQRCCKQNVKCRRKSGDIKDMRKDLSMTREETLT